MRLSVITDKTFLKHRRTGYYCPLIGGLRGCGDITKQKTQNGYLKFVRRLVGKPPYPKIKDLFELKVLTSVAQKFP